MSGRHRIDRFDTHELADLVDEIIALDDDEAQHGMEDDLRLRLIRAYCPEWVVAEVERLVSADFERWCA